MTAAVSDQPKYVDCGQPPVIVGTQSLAPTEFMYFLYLPVSLPGHKYPALPRRLGFMRPILSIVLTDADTTGRYVYVTAKSMYVDSNCLGNRPGWHIDGFMSNGDVNYIWYDSNPTEFAIQDFDCIPYDDQASMIELERQIDHQSIVTYPSNTLLKLDETVVHRATPIAEPCFRTFIKITVSDHRFTSFGNSRNYLLDYGWSTTERKIEERNLNHG